MEFIELTKEKPSWKILEKFKETISKCSLRIVSYGFTTYDPVETLDEWRGSTLKFYTMDLETEKVIIFFLKGDKEKCEFSFTGRLQDIEEGTELFNKYRNNILKEF